MANKAKINKLVNFIRDNVKDLKSLSKGCIVQNYKGITFEILKAVIDNDKDDFIVYSDANLLLNSVRVNDLPEHKVKIIGREPLLNDVLLCFNESLYSTAKEDKHLSILDMILSEWDYSKPYLKDQSEATINYLFDLAGCS